MDVFGTVATAIGLAFKIKATFEQAEQNRYDGVSLSMDIVESLSRIQNLLNQRPSVPSDNLCENIFEFESELRRILSRQASIAQRTAGSTLQLKELYNADNIRHELADLHQKVQMCYQKLQLTCVVDTHYVVTAMSEQIIALRDEQAATDRKLQLLLDGRIPASSPERRAALDHIEENIQVRISVIDNNGALGKDLQKLLKLKKAASSVKSTEGSLRSLSTSLIDRRFLRRRVRDLAGALPQLRDQASKTYIGTSQNPFQGLGVRKRDSISNTSWEDSIRVALQILTNLRSGEKISAINAVRDLLSLARVLDSLGMEVEARDIYDWGIQICSDLAKDDDTRMLLDLAKFLYRLFADLSSHAELEVCRRVLSQAVQVRHQMEHKSQKVYLVRLAPYAAKLFLELVELERWDAAGLAMQEVVETRRSLTRRDSQRFVPALAESLHQLARRTGKAGRHNDAVKAEREAIEMRRGLVGSNLDVHPPLLAVSLKNMAFHLEKLGRYEEAVAAGEESVEICRELVKNNGNKYYPQLSSSLYGLAKNLRKLGRYEAALNAGEEVVKICQGLIENEQNPYSPYLAASLANLENDLRCSISNDVVGEDVVGFRRERLKNSQSAHLPQLGLSLNSVAYDMAKLGRYEDAVKACEDAVQIFRGLLKAHGSLYLPQLASSLYDLANNLGKSVCDRDGVKPGGKVISARQGPVENDHERYREALKAGQEAVKTCRELIKTNRKTYLPSLASSLDGLGAHLGKAGYYEGAVKAGEEAVRINQELFELNPNSLSPLVVSLYNTAINLERLGRYDDAMRVGKEATKRHQQLFRTIHAPHPNFLVRTLYEYAIHMEESDHQDLVQIGMESLRLYRERLKGGP